MADEKKCKRAKPQHEKQDRLSCLPDSLIHTILSLLPSTKEAIQSSVLSKQWRNQWTHVPVLIFSNSGMSDERFSRFVDNTLLLLDSPKIQKFDILSENYEVRDDPTVFSKLLFTIRKGVEDLVLDFKGNVVWFRLPDYIFKHASLVKLQLYNCSIMTNGVVSWGRLKELIIDNSTLSSEAIENILLGSPLLESLQLTKCFGFSQLKIASKSSKRMVLTFHCDSKFKIWCPKLEELKLFGQFERVEFEELSSLVCATLDFQQIGDFENVIQILQQLQHVEELTFGFYFLNTLAKMEERGFDFNPLLRNKSLTLDYPDFKCRSSGILYALRILPVLEKLVIKDLFYEEANHSTSDCFNWKERASDSLGKHLKTVHIVGLEKGSECEVPLDFIDFLLKNAPVMEKLVMLKGC